VKFLRSWPSTIPSNRSYVVDDIPKLVIENHSYRALGGVDEDVVLLEWDIAVSKEDLLTFAGHARSNPHRVIVAPYRIYYEHLLSAPIWAHRSWNGDGVGTISPNGAKPVATGTPNCNLFGLGMVYLPRPLVRQFIDERYSNHFGDVEFSMWHYQRATKDVPIMWDVRPVHLNYQIPTL
jgi:hypothetical protein